MADNVDSKETSSPPVTASNEAPPSAPSGPLVLPQGWMYKKFFGKNIWYASPKFQLFMVAMVCFLCPGMFNAITGMGAGGQVDPHASDKANTALYSVFAVVGFFSGSFANRLGVRATLAIGGIGYCIYAASFLSYSHNENQGFVIFAGAFLGLCAGLLWTGQGTIMMAYPPENQKGRYISYFWIIFNLGAVIGALIPLGQNIHTTTASAVTDGTYAGFIVLMFLGLVLAIFLVDANKIIREDGSRVILMKNPSWQSEIKGLYETLTNDWWILLLFPMMFSSNLFYTYQTNEMNPGYFNTRTRSLNNVLYWLSQIFGAVLFGHLLDYTKVRRSMRARIALVTLFSITFIVWGGGWAWQKDQLPREQVGSHATTFVAIDWTDGGKKYIGPMFLYIFFGFFDACWQTCTYWYMGALSNSGRKAANLAGFYKGIQSAGAAIFWRLDDLSKPYNTVYGATWGLLAGSLLIAAPLIFMRIQDTVPLEDDLKFSDETAADVVAPGALAAKETGEV